MPWTYKVLRGQKVLARCDAEGKLALDGGRVEIRYKPTDAKAYRAAERNLESAGASQILPDDHCVDVPADGAPPASASAAKPASAARAASTSAPSPSRPPIGPADVVVYADGACSGNPGPAGLGVAIFDGDEKRELSEYLGHGTNNIAELTAIQRALEALAGDERTIEIKTDSSYSIGVLTKAWKAKANQELIVNVKAALAKVKNVRLTYVKGHAGIAGNELADALARAAVDSRKTSGWIRSKKK
jgi:ribonuclease HI